MTLILHRKPLEILWGCSLVSEKRFGISFDQPVDCRNCLENINEKKFSLSTSFS